MRGIAIATALLLWVMGAASARADGAASLARLQAWLDGATSLSGRFVQELQSGALGGDIVEKGRLWVERPGKLRWEYLSPESKTAIVVGDRTILYLASERQMFEGRVDPDAALLSVLLSGTERLSALFATSAADPPSNAGGDRIRLRPISGSGGAIEEAIVTVRRSDGAIQSAVVLDAAGNRMVYRFEGLERNRRIPDGTFSFEPPPGTEVLAQP